MFGLFEEDGIMMMMIQIECDGDMFLFVVVGECGLLVSVVVGSKCQMILFNMVYLLQCVVIKVDEIQNLCVFGFEIELEVLQIVVNCWFVKMCCQFDVMYEFYCIGVIKGVVFDVDGKMVLIDLLQYFGIEQMVILFELGKVDIEICVKCVEV